MHQEPKLTVAFSESDAGTMDTLRRRQTPAGHVLEMRSLKILRAYRVGEGVNSGSAPAIPISCWNGARVAHHGSSLELAPRSRLAFGPGGSSSKTVSGVALVLGSIFGR
jgi:hypothetical protein